MITILLLRLTAPIVAQPGGRGGPEHPVSLSTLVLMDLYAAYGSNLDPERMALRAPHSPLRGSGWLVGWRLTFGGERSAIDGALATLVEDPTAQVYVSLYDVTPGDEQALDEWEGLASPQSRKIHVRVQTLDGDVL